MADVLDDPIAELAAKELLADVLDDPVAELVAEKLLSDVLGDPARSEMLSRARPDRYAARAHVRALIRAHTCREGYSFFHRWLRLCIYSRALLFEEGIACHTNIIDARVWNTE